MLKNCRYQNSCLETAEIAVTSVDNEDPYILDYSYSQENDFLEIVVKDNQSGINYSQLMALTASGSALTPTSVDLEKGVLIYPIPPEDFILTLTDLAGNQSQHLVKIQKKYI